MTLQLVTTQASAPEGEEAERLQSALKVVDSLRADLMSGKLKSFVAVGIAEDHATYRYQASAKKTTRLELLGALEWTKHCAMTEE